MSQRLLLLDLKNRTIPRYLWARKLSPCRSTTGALSLAVESPFFGLNIFLGIA